MLAVVSLMLITVQPIPRYVHLLVINNKGCLENIFLLILMKSVICVSITESLIS